MHPASDSFFHSDHDENEGADAFRKLLISAWCCLFSTARSSRAAVSTETRYPRMQVHTTSKATAMQSGTTGDRFPGFGCSVSTPGGVWPAWMNGVPHNFFPGWGERLSQSHGFPSGTSCPHFGQVYHRSFGMAGRIFLRWTALQAAVATTKAAPYSRTTGRPPSCTPLMLMAVCTIAATATHTI